MASPTHTRGRYGVVFWCGVDRRWWRLFTMMRTVRSTGLLLAIVVLLATPVRSQEAAARQDGPAVNSGDDITPLRPSRRATFEDSLPPLELPRVNLTVLRHHAGEAAVGASAGAIAAWIAHRLQGAAMFLTIIGGVGTAAALHLKWVSPEQVCRRTRMGVTHHAQ